MVCKRAQCDSETWEATEGVLIESLYGVAVVRDTLMSLIGLGALVGCATSSTSSTIGQVQEVAPGTYSIGVSRSSSVMFGGTEGVKAAVDEAGKYCHSKGQKLVILPTKDKDVTFQCGEKIQVPDTPMPVTQEPVTAAPLQLKPH